MVKDIEFNRACTEVCEILKYCSKELIKKIPTETLMLIYGLKDNKIKVEIDPDKPIYDQNISDNAISIILEIADKYWYSEKEKQELRNALKGNKNG